MRGYGKSDRPDDVSAYKMDRLVEDVRGIIAALGKGTLFNISRVWQCFRRVLLQQKRRKSLSIFKMRPDRVAPGRPAGPRESPDKIYVRESLVFLIASPRLGSYVRADAQSTRFLWRGRVRRRKSRDGDRR